MHSSLLRDSRFYVLNSYRKFSIPVSVQDDRKIKKYQDTYTVSHAVSYHNYNYTHCIYLSCSHTYL